MSKQKQIKQQQEQELMRYNPKELSLIANTFKRENLGLIMALRKFFLQGDITEQDAEYLKALTPDVVDVLYKTILPTIDSEAPFGQLVDMWVSINTRDKDPQEVELDSKARLKTIQYLEERFQKIDTPMDDIDKGDILIEKLVYDGKKGTEENYVDLVTRNTIIQHIEIQVQQLIALAERTPADEEEIEKKFFQNSNK